MTKSRREAYRVARCTVARLMTRLGLRGVVRGKVVKWRGPRWCNWRSAPGCG